MNNEKVDVLYAQKYGTKNGIISKGRKSVVHAVFQANYPHGDVYAYISKWLGDKFNKPFVPYMVDLPLENKNMRKELNIPRKATVFGRHGGLNSFDIPFIHDTIRKVLADRKDLYFLFLNTRVFYEHDRII